MRAILGFRFTPVSPSLDNAHLKLSPYPQFPRQVQRRNNGTVGGYNVVITTLDIPAPRLKTIVEMGFQDPIKILH
jgi:hypothetical protein